MIKPVIVQTPPDVLPAHDRQRSDDVGSPALMVFLNFVAKMTEARSSQRCRLQAGGSATTLDFRCSERSRGGRVGHYGHLHPGARAGDGTRRRGGRAGRCRPGPPQGPRPADRDRRPAGADVVRRSLVESGADFARFVGRLSDESQPEADRHVRPGSDLSTHARRRPRRGVGATGPAWQTGQRGGDGSVGGGPAVPGPADSGRCGPASEGGAGLHLLGRQSAVPGSAAEPPAPKVRGGPTVPRMAVPGNGRVTAPGPSGIVTDQS